MASAPRFVQQLLTLWSRLGRTRRVAIGGIAVGAVVFVLLMLQMGRGAPTYVTAFTNLDPKDSNAVVEQLKGDSIPYQLSPDGSTVKVPPERLADARLKLAAKGLPSGGAVGFELFDKTSFGVTDFVQNLNYQRALEGELTRTINTLDPVANSRVHIVVPKQELFASQQKPATASVLLRLRPGRSLDDAALKGIAFMVAKSVQGLSEKNITIVDTSGRTLYDGGQGEGTGVALSATQLDVQRKVEKTVEGQVQTLLDQVAGAGRAAVRVKADMDFDQQETLAETFQPGGPNQQGVPRSSSNVQETFSGAGAGSQQPGATTNVPNLQAVGGSSSGVSQYQRTETTTNFEVSRNTQRTVRTPGQVKRLSVSVLLDSSIPEQDAAGLRDAIAAAAGIDQRRGDQLVVTTAQFSKDSSLDAAVFKPSLADSAFKYGKLAVPLLVSALLLFVLWRMTRGVQARPLAMATTEGALALPGGGAAPALGEGWVSAPDSQVVESAGRVSTYLAERTDLDFEEAQRRAEIFDRMNKLATANPEAIAEIIHNWMTQDDRKKRGS